MILFLDACRSQESSRGLGIGEEKQKGVITIFSCSPNERSYEIEDERIKQGAFTYALLESLRIKGEGNCATVERLYNRLRYQVPDINRQFRKPRQTPYAIVEPASKYHLILLEKQATEQDIATLREEALEAENEGNLELAAQLWTRVLAVSPANEKALKALKRIWQKQENVKLGTTIQNTNEQNKQSIENNAVELRIKETDKKLENDETELIYDKNEDALPVEEPIKPQSSESKFKNFSTAKVIETSSQNDEVELLSDKNVDYTKLLKLLYNKFNPFNPLTAHDPAYVNCSEVRGDDNIFKEVGNTIIYSDDPTCQLYTGHRGVGKSTELLRLEDYLQKNGCFVVYFPATEGDIDELDVQYTDIILACTRNILNKLQAYASPNLLLDWLQSRWHELKDLALSDVEFEKLTIESKINIFSKLTTSLRRIPSTRETIRKQIDNHSVDLIATLNEFIEEAQKKLPEAQSKIVVIPDNLDRIIPIERGNKRTSHDEIFLDYSNQLTALNCHIVYTIPISLAYSSQATELRNIYASPQVLPMIMVKNRQNESYGKGLDKLKEIIEKRVHLIDPEIEIDTQIFDNSETRIKLCQMTGGHVRDLMLLMQSAMRQVDDFPINIKAVNRAISDARDGTYRNAVNSEEWDKLAKVYCSKNIDHNEEYRSLLFRRCVLEYRDVDVEDNPVRWYDIHPLIEGTSEFKSALNRLISNE